MKEHETRTGPFECVEPGLGDQRGLLDDPELEADLRRRLTDHLTICDSCRLDREIVRRADEDLASGRLALDPQRRAPHWRRDLAWGGGLAVAASVALVFLLPPLPAGPDTIRRSGDDTPRFLRPVEGEVLVTSTPGLRWTEVEGATAYRLQISEVGGDELWSARIESNEARIPAAMPLRSAVRYRAVVEPIPADLGGLADVNVTFRRGDARSFLGYRFGAAPALVRWFGLLGATACGAGLLGLLFRGR